MSLMIVSSAFAELVTVSRVVALLARRASVSSSSSVMPMTPFIGVRISWLMLARNSDFEREASTASASARLRSLTSVPIVPVA